MRTQTRGGSKGAVSLRMNLIFSLALQKGSGCQGNEPICIDIKHQKCKSNQSCLRVIPGFSFDAAG